MPFDPNQPFTVEPPAAAPAAKAPAFDPNQPFTVEPAQAAPAAPAVPTMTVHPQPPAAPTPPAHPAGVAERFASGVMDPLYGAGQAIMHGLANDKGQILPNLNHVYDALEHKHTPTPTTAAVDQAIQGREQAIKAEEPKGTDWARLAGNVASPANFIAPTKALGAANLATRIGSGLLQGAAVGAMQPATEKAPYAGQKAAQALVGGVFGAGMSGVEHIVTPIARWAASFLGDTAAENAGVRKVLSRIASDQRHGGPTFQDMLDLAKEAPSKPLKLADVDGANLKGLVGKLARTPGDAKAILNRAIKDRDLDAATRISTDDIAPHLGVQPAFFADKALQESRSAAAKPLYARAFAYDSMPPLRQQVERAVKDARQSGIDALRDLKDTERQIAELGQEPADAASNRPYMNPQARQAKLAELNMKMQDASDRLEQAGADHQAAMGRLVGINDVQNAGIKGSVWSPKLERFIQNPRIKQGLPRGWQIETDEAMAAGRPINPHDYGIVGFQDNIPVLGKTLNMRMLNVVKKGLDGQVEQLRDPNTGRLTEEGVAADKFRRAFVAELDRLNPHYKAAREAWGGETRAMGALRFGQHAFNPSTPLEAIQHEIRSMSPSEREFARLGLANKIREIIRRTGEAGDETRKMLIPENRERMRAFFDSQEAFDKFFAGLNAEHRMFHTFAKTYGNSATAERQAEDLSTDLYAGSHAVRAGEAVARGNPFEFIGHGLQALRGVLPASNPKVDAAAARLLTQPIPEAVQRLQQAQSAPAIPDLGQYAIPPIVAGAVAGMQGR